jgi:dolichol-phosphate mannosyltransferase
MPEGPALSASLYVVVPVLNEARNMSRFFDDLRNTKHEIANIDVRVVLVDDGSSDGTAEIARTCARGLDLTVLSHPVNSGPGFAFGTAFAHLAELVRPGDFVLTMEGDNTSRCDLIKAMLHRVQEGHDAVFASPYMYGGGILNTRPLRVLLSHVANTVVKELLGVHGLLTVSSFFRLYRASSLRRLQACYGNRVIERRGFESMVELVMKMMYLRMSISELPMVLDTTRREGQSKLSIRRTSRGYLALLFYKREWQERAASHVETDDPSAHIDRLQRHISTPR